MAKKKTSREISPGETIHFRPGELLGRMIGRFGDDRGLSRGEAARRLASLSVRGLGVESYELIEELSGYAGCDFDAASQTVYVEIAAEDAVRAKAKQAPQNALEREEVVSLVRLRFHSAYYMALSAKEQKKQVHIRLPEEP